MRVRHSTCGYSAIELLLAAAILMCISAIAAPGALVAARDVGAAAGVRFITSRLYDARFDAMRRNAAVGFRFDDEASGYRFQVFVDGNGNGIRTVDIDRGVDRPEGPPMRIEDQFPDVSFGFVTDELRVANGGDPVRLSGSDILTMGPEGTATPGTLYVKGRGQLQYAIRILGSTGRTRVQQYDFLTRAWVSR